MNNIQVAKVYLKGDSLYQYCPYCIAKMKKEGTFTSDLGKLKERLKPLIRYTFKIPFEKDGQIVADKELKYECPDCGANNITDSTFILFYARRADGTRFNEAPVTPDWKWSAKKGGWALFDWLGGDVWKEREETLDKQQNMR